MAAEPEKSKCEYSVANECSDTEQRSRDRHHFESAENLLALDHVFEWRREESVVTIAAGDGQSLALKQDGTVVAGGRNDYGQATVPKWVAGYG